MPFVLSSCVNEHDQDKLLIYTSFYVMEDFAKKLSGNYAVVKNLVPAGSDVHDYEPTTKDLVNLSQAHLFIYNGAHLEHFINPLKEVMKDENPSLIFVETSLSLELLEEGNFIDPHTWLSPMNAKKQMKVIKDALVGVDVKHQSYYESQYLKYETKFNELDDLYLTFLQDAAGQYLITAHAAFGYLAHAYNLINLPIGSYESSEEPTQQNIAYIINIINEHNIAYIYGENNAPNHAILTILDATNAKFEILYTIEGLTSEQRENHDDYFSLMKDNLLALMKGFL